jgi:hypothetical protein
VPRVGVRDRLLRRLERHPLAGRDALGRLGRRLDLAGLHEEEVADLVDQLAAKAEVPVDRVDPAPDGHLVQPRFLPHLAHGGLLGPFARFEMALGKSPVAIAVPDEQEERTGRADAVDDAAGGGLALGAGTAHGRGQ